MSVAEGYSISVMCDGEHRVEKPRGEFFGHTKGAARAELRKAGWRLGPNFTAYCRACRLKGRAQLKEAA